MTTGYRPDLPCCIVLKLLTTIGMPRSREEVETILTSDVKLALERFQSASSELQHEAAARSLEACRLERAREAKATAAIELRRALRRHTAFILDRVIPEDLLNLPVRARAGGSE